MESQKLKDFIDFAIDQEVQAAVLYAETALRAANRDQKVMLDDLAETERGHEKKLREFMTGGEVSFAQLDKVVDLRLSDFLVDTELKPSSTLQDIFIFAMKKEQKAFELYTLLSGMETDPAVKKFFDAMAAEEKGHKYAFEKQYDSMVLREN